MRAYIFADILHRTFSYAGYEVLHVMNITDVGHLTSDADEGEDKMELGAKREGLDAWAIAKKYEKAFFEQTALLNILRPEIICRATEHIKEQISMVQKLEEKGFTYQTEDGIYFDTSKLSDYGKLARLDIEGLREGERVDVGGKKHKTDFALWKISPKEKTRQMEWDSPWGKGFPGWHIECSAMGIKYLSDHFDIHTGGIDHIPVHHTNEIAQNEAATGHQVVNCWMHNEFVQMQDDEKMSKSKGHVITIETLKEKGFEPLSYRYLCLTSHYRNTFKFSTSILSEAQTAYDRLNKQVIEISQGVSSPAPIQSEFSKDYLKKFEEAIFDDLNTAVALVHLRELLNEKEISKEEKLSLIQKFDQVLALDLGKEKKQIQQELSSEIEELIQKRQEARKNKNFSLSDQIRDQLEEKGIVLEDFPDGSVKWHLKS